MNRILSNDLGSCRGENLYKTALNELDVMRNSHSKENIRCLMYGVVHPFLRKM
jgi:hypothetical protein